MDEYEIEPIQPWLPSLSPGAPIPAPKYVPWDGSLTPGHYYNHTDYFGNNAAKIYNEGIKFRPQLSNTGEPTGRIAYPTAQRTKVDADWLKKWGTGRRGMARLGLPHQKLGWGFTSPQVRADAYGRGGKGSPGSVIAKTDIPLNSPRHKRAPKATWNAEVKMLKGNALTPKMLRDYDFDPRGPRRHWTPWGHAKEAQLSPSKNVAFFPKNSNTPLTKPGMMTGKMPMLRGIGGGLVGSFMEGPEMQKAKSDPYYGLPEAKRRLFESAYAHGL